MEKKSKVASTIIAILLVVFFLGELAESFGRSVAKDFNLHAKEASK